MVHPEKIAIEIAIEIAIVISIEFCISKNQRNFH